MVRALFVGGLSLSVSLLAGCGAGAGPAPSTAPASTEGSAPAAIEATENPPKAAATTTSAGSPLRSDASVARGGATPAPTAPPAPPKRERVRLHNSCAKPVKIRIERVSDSDLDTSLTNGTSTEERATDGDEIRLIGENNKVLFALKIEPSMQLVDFTSDCARIEGK